MPASNLAVLSWNVHGLPLHAAPERLRRVAAWIEERQPDLVLLQEVWSRGYREILARALAPAYDAVSATHPLGALPRGGLLTLGRRRRLRLGRARFEAYRSSAPWYRLGEGDGLSGKGALAVEVEADDLSLVAVNTHLQAQYGERRYGDVRRAQLEQLAAFVAAAAAGRPLLLAGDLNTEAGEELYGTHVVPLGLDLTAEERRARGGTTCFDRRGGRSEWIDYVVLRGEGTPAKLERIENRAPDDPFSDHDGLYVELALAEVGARS